MTEQAEAPATVFDIQIPKLPEKPPPPPGAWWVEPLLAMLPDRNGENYGTRGQAREVLSQQLRKADGNLSRLDQVELKEAIELVSPHVLSIVFGAMPFGHDYQALVHRYELYNRACLNFGLPIPKLPHPNSDDTRRRVAARLFLPALEAQLRGEAVTVKLTEA